MLKYRIYILAVFYIAVILAVLTLFNSRGCYIHPNTDKTMPLIVPEQFYYVGKKFNTVESLSRGDVVFYCHADDQETPHLGRIIALPGDTVEVKNETFYVNGKETDCSYGNPTTRRRPNTTSLPLIAIPQNIMYVLPDNRVDMDFADKQFFIHIFQVRGKLLKSFFKDESYR